MSVQVCVHAGRCSSLLLSVSVCVDAVVCHYRLQSKCAIPLCVYVRELQSLQHSQSIISTDSRGRTMRENKRGNKTKKKKKK